MKPLSDNIEPIFAGETASLENIQGEPLSISLHCDNGCHIEIDLLPGQVMEFSAGNADARVVLHHGDPDGLSVIKPESPS